MNTYKGTYLLYTPPFAPSQPVNPLTRQHVMPAVIKCTLCFRNSYTPQLLGYNHSCPPSFVRISAEDEKEYYNEELQSMPGPHFTSFSHSV